MGGVMSITKNEIVDAYAKYNNEFDYNFISVTGAFHPFESTMLYSLMRLIKPKKIIEMSPDKGLTTKIMIDACNKNKIRCKIYSFDVHDASIDLDEDTEEMVFRKLIIGDAKETLTDEYLKNCDFMFIDSDHSAEFATWYCDNILPKLKRGVLIWIHDWVGLPMAPERDVVESTFVDAGNGEKILFCPDILAEWGLTNDRPGGYLNNPSQILIRK